MKNTIYILAILFALSSCKKENRLDPSQADQLPLTELPDLSKTLIKNYNENYGLNIVYRYSDTADFRFSFQDKGAVASWKSIKIKKLSPAKVDFALAKLEDLVLKYFKDQIEFEGKTMKPDLKKRVFPKHLFLADSLSGNYDNTGQYLKELNLYETDKYYSFLWNGYEPMFGFSEDIFAKSTSTDIVKFRNSILYSFISSLFLHKGLINELPTEFFANAETYYGKVINDQAREDGAPLLDGGPGGKYKYYHPQWYASKGFAMTNSSPFNTGRYTKETQYTTALDTTKTMNFPDRHRDLRNMLHVAICEDNVTSIRNYLKVPAFTQRMRILIRQLYTYGIDVYAINPVAREYFVD